MEYVPTFLHILKKSDTTYNRKEKERFQYGERRKKITGGKITGSVK